MSSITKRPNGRYRARFRDPDGKEHAKHFALKKEAQGWLDERVTGIGTGTYVAPDRAKMTVSQWCDEWLKGYTGHSSTIRQAESHIKVIKAGFDGVRLRDVRPSMVKAWTKTLAETRKPSTVYAIYSRFSQVMTAAHRDGLIYRSPCSREVAPPMGKQRPYVATAAQVQAIHDAFPEHLRPAVALAAFAGLRVAEVAGLRVQDVDVDEGMSTRRRTRGRLEPTDADAGRVIGNGWLGVGRQPRRTSLRTRGRPRLHTIRARDAAALGRRPGRWRCGRWCG